MLYALNLRGYSEIIQFDAKHAQSTEVDNKHYLIGAVIVF